MKTLLPTIALAAATASSALAQPAERYYNTVPTSQAPAIIADPSPCWFIDGDYVIHKPNLRILSELQRQPPDHR